MNKKQKREADKAAKAKAAAKPATSGGGTTGEVVNMAERKQVNKQSKQSSGSSQTVNTGTAGTEGQLAKLPPMPRQARARKPKPLVACSCGCGMETRSMWVPGHDARHKGWIARIKAGVVKIDDERITDGERGVLKLAMKGDGPLDRIAAAKAKAGKAVKPEGQAGVEVEGEVEEQNEAANG